MSMEHLITDRTQSDVDHWKALRDKGWNRMSTAEQAAWLAEMKGRYDHRDFNRVEQAVSVVSDRLRELGYVHPPLTVKTDWTRAEIPTRGDWERYFGNVATLRKAITVLHSTPGMPSMNDRLNFERANALEQILVDIDDVATKISESWHYAGDISLGEV